MKKLNRKDLKIRLVVQTAETLKRSLKALYVNRRVSSVLKFKVQQALSKLSKNSSKTRIVNRCVFTGRSRSVFNLYNLSRIQIKELACNGMLPGLKKISW